MVKKRAGSGVEPLPLIIIAVAAVIAIAAAAYFLLTPNTRTDQVGPVADCLPASVRDAETANLASTRPPGDLNVYVDASGGMRGYASAGTPNALGNLMSLSLNFTKSSNYAPSAPGTTRFFRFGDYRFDPKSPEAPALVETAEQLARPAAFNEENTRLADVLRWIEHRHDKAGDGADPLSIVVTDLMLDDREAVDAFEASVGGALRNLMIDEKLSVGLLAVRVPFDGNVFVGDAALRAAVPDRPLIILMIGDPFQVRAFYDYLDTSEIAPFSSDTALTNRRFALFGLEASAIADAAPQLSGTGSGFSSRSFSLDVPGTQDLKKFSFRPGAADEDSKARLRVRLDAGANKESYEVIGDEPVSVGFVWQLDEAAFDPAACNPQQVWSHYARLGPDRALSKGQQAVYSLGPDEMEAAGMDRKGTYLVQMIAGQRGLVREHEAVEWMGEWSDTNDRLTSRLRQSETTRGLGVPGLQPLRNILLAELLIPGREEIERSSAQFVIRTE